MGVSKNLKKLKNEIVVEKQNERDGMLVFTYHGIDIKGVVNKENIEEISNYGSSQEHLINLIIDSISKRIEFDETKEILKAGRKLFSPERPSNRSELSVFGRDYLQLVLEHFMDALQKAECDVEAVLDREWLAFKHYVNTRRNNWHQVFVDPELTKRFSNINKVAEIFIVLPMSTSVCERGFSALKRVKTDWRNKLILNLHLNAWWNGLKRSRRPGFMKF